MVVDDIGRHKMVNFLRLELCVFFPNACKQLQAKLLIKIYVRNLLVSIVRQCSLEIFWIILLRHHQI